jgi:lipoprotein-anchoring transpeptidase ErfK/SrfK
VSVEYPMSGVAPRLRRALALGLVSLSLSTLAPAAANAATDPEIPAAADPAPDDLRPGQFRWHPEAAPAEGPVSIVVSIPLQRAWVFRAGALIGVSTISSGQPGYDTPTGAFPILQKRVDHRSNIYDGAPMPYMQRLTWDGIALHAGQIPGHPASHGCVRLPRAFAQRLYGVTELGALVVVSDEAPATPAEALALAAPIPAEIQLAAD